jgi:hypothetical protein
MPATGTLESGECQLREPWSLENASYGNPGVWRMPATGTLENASHGNPIELANSGMWKLEMGGPLCFFQSQLPHKIEPMN